MSRFDVEKFDTSPDPDLICCICQCVLDGPVESPCRHVFCKICIETWLQHNRNCPTCRHRLKKRHLKPILPIVQNMLNRLSMFCDFRINGCQERVPLEMYDKHINECDFKMMNCKYEKCFDTVLRKFLKKHEEEECEHREKLCTRVCGLMIPVRIYDGHDCVEELRKYSLEQYALVDTLKKKVNELNTMTEKLNQQIETLRREHRRSPSYDYLNSPSNISSNSGFSESWLDDYSQYTSSERFSDQEDRRHGMTFEEFDRQDRNFWRSMRDLGDSPRRRRRYRRGVQRDSREEHSGEIDVVNTPPRSPSPFYDQDGSDVEVDVVNESDAERSNLQHELYSPRTSHRSRRRNRDSSEMSYRSGSYQSRHSSSRDSSRSFSRESHHRRRHSSRSSSSNRTLRNRSWSSHYSDRSIRSEVRSPRRSFQSSRSASPNSILSGESSLYHFRRRHSSRRFISSSRSRSRSYSRSHSRSRSRSFSPDYSRSRSHSSDRRESSPNSDRDRTNIESDTDSHISTSPRFSQREDIDYRSQTEGDHNNSEIHRNRRPSDQSDDMYSSDDACYATRDWLPGRRNTRNQPDQRQRGSLSPERPFTRSQQTSDTKQTNSTEKSATRRSQSDSGFVEESCSSSENVQTRSTSKRKRTETAGSTNDYEDSDSKRRKREQPKTQSFTGSSSATSSSHQTRCDTCTTEHQERGHRTISRCGSCTREHQQNNQWSNSGIRSSTIEHQPRCQRSNSRCGASTTEQQLRNLRSNSGCGTSTNEHQPRCQRSNSRQSTVTSQRVLQVQDTRSEHSLLDTENYNSDSDYTWEPGTSPEDSNTSLSVYDTGSDYEVLIPKSAGQLLSEYASDESDESWNPESPV